MAEQHAPHTPIPLTLITGFLGSGKTSLLEHIIQRHGAQKLVYLVNEFAPVDMDGRRLSVFGKDLVEVPGGSIFCSCLVTDFLDILQWIPKRYGADLDGVVIEASGMANPKVIGRMLRETQLDGLYRLAQVVTVVDPATYPTLRQTLPNIVAQVEAADLILLNKTDLHPEADIAALETELRAANPTAQIHRSTYGRLPEDWTPDGTSTAGRFKAEYALCRDPNYRAFVASFDAPVADATYIDQLRGLESELYRVKGFVPMRDGVLYLEYAGGHWTADMARNAPQEPPWELVLIARGEACADTEAWVAGLNAAPAR